MPLDLATDQPSLDVDVGHLGVARAIGASFLTYRLLCVLQELERCFSWSLVFHLVDCLLDEAEQVVDVLRINKVILVVLVEVDVSVENLN